jgi:uncharacterized protein (DUF362 family)
MATTSDLPPLISPSSPSYERARHELKHPAPTGDPVVVAVLARLVEVEQGARQTCLAAAAAVTEPTLARTIGEACETHKERVEALGQLITELGGSPPRLDEARDLISNGPAAIEKASSDEGIVGILRAMRLEVAELYAETARAPELDEAQRKAIADLV